MYKHIITQEEMTSVETTVRYTVMAEDIESAFEKIDNEGFIKKEIIKKGKRIREVLNVISAEKEKVKRPTEHE